MEKTRALFLSRLFCAFMALYLFNCSVDSPDTQKAGFADNLEINDQESLLEILIEKVFGYNDAIAEYDDDDSENQLVKKNISLDHYIFPQADTTVFIFEECTGKITGHKPRRITHTDFSVLSPPPEA